MGQDITPGCFKGKSAPPKVASNLTDVEATNMSKKDTLFGSK